MSRKVQDIPIRPRYGIDNIEMDQGHQQQENINCAGSDSNKSKAISNNNNSGQNKTSEKMASSYSEIPFLAQYTEHVPDGGCSNSKTTTERQEMEIDENTDDEDDVDSSENNSKDSSEEMEPASRIKGDTMQKRPSSLHCESTFPYDLGRTSHEGEMHHFVADNLEQQLRAGSPLNRPDPLGLASCNSTPSTSTASGLLTRHFLQTQRTPQMDANVLSDIEIEAQYLAASVDNLTENLCNLLHSISSITADNVEIHKNAVNKLTDNMDANIKCMYTIMAKTEEISKSMKPTEQLGQRIHEIKRLVDMLDATM